MRRRDLQELTNETYDVLVIGAGINGCAAAQQLAAQGFKTIIIDKGDFAEGATSKSSRLLHCGLRHLAPGKSVWSMLSNPVYLATALINAKKAMDARSDIAHSLPELTRPSTFYFPIFKQDAFAPSMVDMAFGLLYALGPKDLPLDYKHHKPKKLDQVPFTPFLRNQEEISGISSFTEYLFDWPERIAIDTVLDASRMGAEVRNYTAFESLSRNVDGIWEILLRDQILPESHAKIRAKVVLNVGGAWSDQIADKIKPTQSQRVVKLKGAHIAVRLPDELSGKGMIAMNRVNEPFYCVPNRGLHLIGLNRIPYERDASNIYAEEAEVDWLLSEANYMMPKLNLSRKNVEYSMAGLQPITFDKNDPHGSRAIKIHDLSINGLENILTLTGGPIMTHRRVGKDLAAAVRAKIAPSFNPQALSAEVSKTTRQLDAKQQGPNASQINPELLQRIATDEQPKNLADVLFRRTGMAWNPDHARDQVAEVAEIISPSMGWGRSRTKKEIDIYHKFLDREFSNYRSQ